MRFHYIYDSDTSSKTHRETIPRLLTNACRSCGIDCVPHDIAQKSIASLPLLTDDDLLYRCATTQKAARAEHVMVSDTCTTFRTRWQDTMGTRGASYFTHNKLGLPVIPSYPIIPRTESEYKDCIDTVGPFPIILKVLGGTLGVGVIRVDTIESMRSALDYLASVRAQVLIRKYIAHEYYVRAVVVGDRVVASHAAYAVEGEFRTNAGDDTHQKRKSVRLSPELERTVVQSVHALGIETGGVDLLFDQEGKAYIAEVNFPNNFTVTARVTGIDIAQAMVEYLIQKRSISINAEASKALGYQLPYSTIVKNVSR